MSRHLPSTQLTRGARRDLAERFLRRLTNSWPEAPGLLSADPLIDDLVTMAADLAEGHAEHVLTGTLEFTAADEAGL